MCTFCIHLLPLEFSNDDLVHVWIREHTRTKIKDMKLKHPRLKHKSMGDIIDEALNAIDISDW